MGLQCNQHRAKMHDDQFVLGAFNQRSRNLGYLVQGSGSNGVMLTDFKQGFMFNIFDVTQDVRGFDRNARHATKEGHLQLDIGFGKPLPGPLVMFVLNEYHSAMRIDKNRNVTYDFLA